MSDIGKHLFEIRYGSVWYRGEVIAETEKTWTATTDGRRPRRVMKSGDIIASTDRDADQRAEQVFREHEARCRDLEDAARAARREQREAVMASLLPEGE